MNTNGNGSLDHQSSGMGTDQEVRAGILLDTVRRHPLIILGTAVLTLAGMYIHLGRLTPLYTSRARVYVDQRIKVIGESEEGVMTTQDNYLYTQAEVLRSSPVLRIALDSLDTGRMETFRNAGHGMYVLSAGLEATVGKMDGIINVRFKGPHPVEAAVIVDAVVDAYVAFQEEEKRRKVAALLEIIREEKAEADAKASEMLAKIREFRQQNESLAFGSDQANNFIMRQMESLLTELSEAKAATRQAKRFHDTALSLTQDPAALRQFLEARRGRTIDDTTTKKLASLQAELALLEEDKTNVLLELKPGHPAVKALDTEIERTQGEITECERLFVEGQITLLRQEYLAAKQRAEELAQQRDAQYQKVLQVNDQLTRYAELQADYEEAREPSGILDARIDELGVAEAVGGLTVTILERAMIPGAPSEPRKTRLMAIAVILGMCAGVGLGLIREICDQRLRSLPEISRLLKLPVLGVIPAIRSPMRSRLLRAKIVRVCPVSPEAEAFRRLRTPLVLGTFSGKAKILLITSPAAGEGKTTVASNLALALAQAGQRVVLVDADCHTPRQHKIFKKDRQRGGLSSVLTGRMALEKATESTSVDRLDLLTCGPDVSDPAEMLGGNRFREAMATLADRYDRVLIDSPPVLAVTDAQILGAQCDGVILVLRAETSTHKDSVQAYVELARVDAHVLGVVVNATPRKRGCYRYNRHYLHRCSIEALVEEKGRAQNKLLPPELLFAGKSQLRDS